MFKFLGYLVGRAVLDFRFGYNNGINHVSRKSAKQAKKELDRRMAELDTRIVHFLNANGKVSAIKLHRDMTGSSLADAVAYVNALKEKYQINCEAKF